MGEDKRGVVPAMPATWLAALLYVMTSVCAVEGRCLKKGTASVQMMRGREWSHALTGSCPVNSPGFQELFIDFRLNFRSAAFMEEVLALGRTVCVFGVSIKGFN